MIADVNGTIPISETEQNSHKTVLDEEVLRISKELIARNREAYEELAE
jgi:hypothetical protein